MTSIILRDSGSLLCIGCFNVIVYHKNPFRIIFNSETETCDQHPLLITNSHIVNEENVTCGYTTRQLHLINILAQITLTFFI